MASSDWEEIKRLAADFQRAQLTSSLQKLSDRNCIEIINKLSELKLIDIHHTSDGKEYITPAQLDKEIKEELFVHGGRINLTELCGILCIDSSLMEKRATVVANFGRKLNLVLGQLISEEYLDNICEEVNEKLQQDGSITISDIARMYDLPGYFVLKVVVQRLGSVIFGQQDSSDPDTVFTEAFVERHKAQVRGVLSAITRPTPITTILQVFKFQEKLFFSIAEKFISSGLLAGRITGGRQALHAVYTPNIYSHAQFDWVSNFFNQNGYLEYESVYRLGISDPESYIKRNLQTAQMWYVSGACIGQLLMDQIEVNIEDTIANGGLVDISPFLPSGFAPSVCSELIELCLKRRSDKTEDKRSKSQKVAKCHVFADTVLFSDTLLTKTRLKLEEMMSKRANEEIAKGAFKPQVNQSNISDFEGTKNKKEDRRKKAAGGKAGGGTQGRETKTKSTKSKLKGKKGHQQHDSDSDDDNRGTQTSRVELEFMTLERLQEEISKFEDFEDATEELVEDVASHLEEELNRKFNEVTKEVYVKMMQGGGTGRKQNHKLMQEKIVSLATTVRLAHKSFKEFDSDVDLQAQLSKYLLRTHCSEILNEIVIYLANESQIVLKETKELTSEIRSRVIHQLSDELKQPLNVSHKSINSGSVEDFVSSLELSLAAADIMWKGKDNKKEKQFLQQHRMCLLEQLSASMEPSLTLHLTCLIIFLSITGGLVHASGKFVPQIIPFLKPHMTLDHFLLLLEFQGLVMQSLTLKEDDPDLSATKIRLEVLDTQVKEFAVTFKKLKNPVESDEK